MTRFDDRPPVLNQPLARAGALLEAQVVSRPDPRIVFMASFAFALSGLALAFIMLMGLGYESAAPRTAESSEMQDARLIPYGQVSAPEIVEAVPMRDEEGRLMPQASSKP